MNGAVHGDAMTTASTPEPNASSVRLFAVQPATPEGASWPNSNTPDRLIASTKKSTASAVTTAGDCSWNPQPSCSPAARNPASANTIASTRLMLAGAGGGARFSTGAAASGGFSPATTEPASGTSSVAARALAPFALANPLLAVMTPSTCLKS